MAPGLLSEENRRKIEPKELPSCLIPRILAVFTQQLEILVTALHTGKLPHSIYLLFFQALVEQLDISVKEKGNVLKVALY